MKSNRYVVATFIAVLAWTLPVCAQIVVLSTFNPPNVSALCGIGRDPVTGNLWVYPCSGDSILGFSPSGAPIGSIPRPGESADDVDVTFAHRQIVIGGTTIPVGTLLFINGETGVADIYSVNTLSGAPLDTLVTSFGVSHVVGGGYHSGRNSFFLVQDDVPSAAINNTIAEVDPATGDTLRHFRTTGRFNVSFGDVEVSEETGNLFVVSSDRDDSLAEFNYDGSYFRLHDLPATVSNPTGIALDCAAGEAWVSSNNGTVYRLGQFPCGVPSSVHSTTVPMFQLSTARPNPFDARTSFILDILRAQHAHVALYDALGREVDVIHDGIINAGEQVFMLDGDLPSGVYVIRVSAEEFAATQRVVRR